MSTPTIADFTNAQHDHGTPGKGGPVPISSVTNLQSTLDSKVDSSDVLTVAQGGTGLSNSDGSLSGDYLRYGSGNIIMASASPASVLTDIGAIAKVTDPIAWTTLTLAGPASVSGVHRVMRHGSGLVEIQLDVSIGSGFNNGDTIASLPSWATPTNLLAFPAAT